MTLAGQTPELGSIRAYIERICDVLVFKYISFYYSLEIDNCGLLLFPASYALFGLCVSFIPRVMCIVSLLYPLRYLTLTRSVSYLL